MKYIDRLLHRIYENITIKSFVLISLGFILFTGGVLPFIANLTTSVIGVSESPDTNFTFNLSMLYEMLEAYGKEGRNFYVLMRWTFDVIWPVVYTGFIVSLIAYFTKVNTINYHIKQYIFPILAILFDYLENTLATIVMVIYPIEIDLISYLLFTSSIIKWGTLSIAFLIAIYYIVYAILKKIQNKT
jgi:hypothetical protein